MASRPKTEGSRTATDVGQNWLKPRPAIGTQKKQTKRVHDVIQAKCPIRQSYAWPVMDAIGFHFLFCSFRSVLHCFAMFCGKSSSQPALIDCISRRRHGVAAATRNEVHHTRRETFCINLAQSQGISGGSNHVNHWS